MAIVIGSCWTNFFSQKSKRRILAIFGFNNTVLHATQPKLYSMFYALFLKIALTGAEMMSFAHLGAAIWHRWTIICGVPSKIIVTSTSQRKLKLLRAIFVKALVKYSYTHTLDNVLKNVQSQLRQSLEWNYFLLLTGIKKDIWENIQQFFFTLYVYIFGQYNSLISMFINTM